MTHGGGQDAGHDPHFLAAFAGLVIGLLPVCAPMRVITSQVGLGFDAVERCRADQCVEESSLLASGIATGEELVFPAMSHHRPDSILGCIVR